ncbi:MAG: hypothetical protein KTR31_37640 [Myxococcales bacterium]|nr:hypothetical protein [Myxococcales bacterium]
MMCRTYGLCWLAFFSVGCASSLEAEQLVVDLQEPPATQVPMHRGEDGEWTRLTPPRDLLPDDVLAGRVDAAHVAFVGRVVSKEHRDVHLPGHGRVPHTFVTFEVEDPVKGGVVGETATLRFVGGPTEDGSVSLTVSGVPEFRVGERDLLFVREDNGRTLCPLVQCEAGRLEVVGDTIRSPTGHVLVTEAGKTRFVAASEPARSSVGAPMRRADVVRRWHRPGPSAASLSVSPGTLTR